MICPPVDGSIATARFHRPGARWTLMASVHAAVFIGADSSIYAKPMLPPSQTRDALPHPPALGAPSSMTEPKKPWTEVEHENLQDLKPGQPL